MLVYLQKQFIIVLYCWSWVDLCTLTDQIINTADAIFCESTEERSPEDKQRRAKKTFEEMMKYLPGTS